MGLQRIPRKLSDKSRIWNVTRLLENQNLLNNHLASLLRLSNDVDLPYDIEEQFEFHRFEDDHFLRLDAEQLLRIYAQQYEKVEEAIAIGAERRMMRQSPVLGDEMAQQIDEELFQSILAMANRRMTPEEMRIELDRIIGECKPGDIIDTISYRGRGYFLVLDVEAKERRVKSIKSVGQYGCHLPLEAWQFIQLHGIEFFDAADVWACYLPPHTKIVANGRVDRTSDVISSSSILVAWLYSGDEIEVEGFKYRASIWDIC